MAMLLGINAIATADIQPELRNIIYGQSALLTRTAQKKGFRDFSGLSIQEPFAFKRLPRGAIRRGGTVPADFSDTESNFNIAPKLYYADVPLLAFDGLRNDGPESALSLAEMRMAEGNVALGEIMGASMYFSGLLNATVGSQYFANYAAGANTFFDFIDTTALDTDVVFFDGLSQWLDDGSSVTTVGGQTRSLIGPAAGIVQGGNSYVANIAGTIQLTDINKAIGRSNFKPHKIDTITMDTNSFQFINNKIQPLQRFGAENASMASLGFEAIKHAGREYVEDNLCPPGAFFGFASPLLHVWVSRRELGRFGFTGFKTSQTTVGDTLGQVVFFGNMSYPSPRVGFRLYGATN
jgi:hypothetical protein